MSERIRVVVSTHLGNPWGGIGTLYADLFNSRFADLLQLYYVDNHPKSFNASQGGRVSHSNLFSALDYYARYLEALLQARPQVAHIATAFGLSFFKNGISVILGRLFGARVVLAPHCSYERLMRQGGGWQTRFWRSYALFVFRRCNGLIALSKEWLVVQDLLPNCLVEYLPNSIDLAPYRSLPRPRATAKSDGAGTDQPVKILFLGHFGVEKGTFDLVRAAAQIDRMAHDVAWHIEIRGEPACPGDRERLQQLIDELSLQERVHLGPAVFDADKIACFASADIFVLPSYHEGMPVSIIEAMASGLPVVATNVGGIPDMVADRKDALLLPPGQPEALAQALAELIQDPGRRMAMGLKGRQHALECHDLDARIPDLVRFHERVANGERGEGYRLQVTG